MLIAAMIGGVHAVQYAPRVPPSEAGFPAAYDFLDLGPAPAVACSCVPTPFALPAYHPGWGYGAGPGVPSENAPISKADRRRNAEWYAEEGRERLPQMSANGLAGNSADSLGVAMHLALHAAIVGPDDRVEAEAVRWLRLAADQGHVDALRLLAHRYAHGRGVAQDYAIAGYLFDQGARHDDPISMAAIGFLHAAGRGVAQSWPEAIRWWRRAETRTPLASRYLGDAYACGAGVDEDRERAVAAYRRFADQDPANSIQLGYMYVRGCAPRDDKAALAAFRRAADQGYPEAQVEMSELLREGRGAEPSPYEAYYWARLAERRLTSGDLKTRAQERAAAAARMMSTLEIADGDRMVTAMIESCAKPMR